MLDPGEGSNLRESSIVKDEGRAVDDKYSKGRSTQGFAFFTLIIDAKSFGCDTGGGRERNFHGTSSCKKIAKHVQASVVDAAAPNGGSAAIGTGRRGGGPI